MAAFLTPAFMRFARYTLFSMATFLLDLGLLAIFTQFAHVPLFLGTPLALLIAVSVNYVFSRRHVFRGTERSLRAGYFYFILSMAAGAVFITAGVYVLATYFHLFYLLARVLVGIVTGIVNYLINLHLNFRVAGKH